MKEGGKGQKFQQLKKFEDLKIKILEGKEKNL